MERRKGGGEENFCDDGKGITQHNFSISKKNQPYIHTQYTISHSTTGAFPNLPKCVVHVTGLFSFFLLAMIEHTIRSQTGRLCTTASDNTCSGEGGLRPL